jgi:hypothetical protein
MGKTFERHEAVVSVNQDPELRGRIKVICPALTGDEAVILPVWCEPVLDWGWFSVPDVGETVEIEVASQDDLDEVFGQANLEDHVPRWRGKRFLTDAELEDDADGSVASPVHTDFTATAYGKRRGIHTPHGHVLLFDDTEGAPQIHLTMQKDALEPGAVPEAAAYSRLTFEADGSVTLQLLDTAVRLRLDAATKEATLELDGAANSLKLAANLLQALLDGGDALKVEGNAASAVLTLGDGAKSVAIAEALQDYIDTSVKMEFDAHTHPTGMGPSGPPAAPLTAYNTAITSSKLKIPNG